MLRECPYWLHGWERCGSAMTVALSQISHDQAIDVEIARFDMGQVSGEL